MKKVQIQRYELYGPDLLPDNGGDLVLYIDHISAMNTCVKCGSHVTDDWDEHIMTCKKSPAVMMIKALEKKVDYYKGRFVLGDDE